MVRTVTTSVLSALAVMFLAAPVMAQTAPTIAIVDIQKIQAESKAAQSLQKQIQAKREAFQKEFSTKEKELETAQKDLVGQQGKLSAEDFNKKRVEFEKKVSDTKSLFEKRRNSLVKGSDTAGRELEKNIMSAAAKVAEAKNFDIVLTRASVLIAEKNLDITPEVLKELDAAVTDIKLKVE